MSNNTLISFKEEYYNHHKISQVKNFNETFKIANQQTTQQSLPTTTSQESPTTTTTCQTNHPESSKSISFQEISITF